MTRRKEVGIWGEKMACEFLLRKGFVVLEKNYFATLGEIDIVAKHGGDYYFIEVKTRRAGDMANDLAITLNKKMKLEKTIRHYCYHRNIGDVGKILAGLMVVYNEQSKTVKFKMATIF
ncbi:YraN family protein [Patescibacteria group bacterium]|nr:YraN family protein [Patescibacteria group bacterium]